MSPDLLVLNAARAELGLTALVAHGEGHVKGEIKNAAFELLHPRGRDGRFIEKGGEVKVFKDATDTEPPILGKVEKIVDASTILVRRHDNNSLITVHPKQLEQVHEVAHLNGPHLPDKPLASELHEGALPPTLTELKESPHDNASTTGGKKSAGIEEGGSGSPGSPNVEGGGHHDHAALDKLRADIASIQAKGVADRKIVDELNDKLEGYYAAKSWELDNQYKAQLRLEALRNEAAPLVAQLYAQLTVDAPTNLSDPEAAHWAGLPLVATEKSDNPLDVNVRGKIRDQYVGKDAMTRGNNAALRDQNPSPSVKAWATRVSKMVHGERAAHDTVLYRGGVFNADTLAQIVPGSKLHTGGFMSTGGSVDMANLYAKNRSKMFPGTGIAIFEIRTPKGTPLADVNYNEFVLDKGHDLHIISTKYENDSLHVVASLTPPTAQITTPNAVEQKFHAPSGKKFEILPEAERGESGDGYHSAGFWGKYGASGVLISGDQNGEKKYLLVQRGPGVHSNKGRWQLPGGAMESKENPYQGAARETNEELGFNAQQIASLQPTSEDVFNGPSGWKYTSITAHSPSGLFTPQVDGHETGDAKWFTETELDKMLADGKVHPALAPRLEGLVHASKAAPATSAPEQHEAAVPGMVPNATHDELTALSDYVQIDDNPVGANIGQPNGYLAINGLLRSGDEAHPHVEHLDSLIAKSAVPHETTVTRYMRTGSLKTPNKNLAVQLEPGSTVTDLGYVSTSKADLTDMAGPNADMAYFEIKVPAGAHALDVDAQKLPDFSPDKNYPIGEHELLLPRGSSFKVISDEKNASGRRIVKAELVFGEPHTSVAPATPDALNKPLVVGPDWKKIGGQAGSNPGGTYESPDGQRYYVKAAKDESHASNEVAAANLYKAMGIDVPQVQTAMLNGKLAVASPIVPDSKQDLKTHLTDESYLNEIRKGFAADALLSNWDVIGAGYDNVVTDANGKPWRIDMGGSLLFRAMGDPKGSHFGTHVDELKTFRQAHMNGQANAVFGGMTDEQIKNSAEEVRSLTDQQIKDAVLSAGFKDKAASDLVDKIRARRTDLLKQIDALSTAPAPEKAVAPAKPEKSLQAQAYDFAGGFREDMHDMGAHCGPEDLLPGGSLNSELKHWLASTPSGDDVTIKIPSHSEVSIPRNIAEGVRDGKIKDFKKPSETITPAHPVSPPTAPETPAAPSITPVTPPSPPAVAVSEYLSHDGKTKIEIGAHVVNVTKGHEGVVTKYAPGGKYAWVKTADGKSYALHTGKLKIKNEEPKPETELPKKKFSEMTPQEQFDKGLITEAELHATQNTAAQELDPLPGLPNVAVPGDQPPSSQIAGQQKETPLNALAKVAIPYTGGGIKSNDTKDKQELYGTVVGFNDDGIRFYFKPYGTDKIVELPAVSLKSTWGGMSEGFKKNLDDGNPIPAGTNFDQTVRAGDHVEAIKPAPIGAAPSVAEHVVGQVVSTQAGEKGMNGWTFVRDAEGVVHQIGAHWITHVSTGEKARGAQDADAKKIEEAAKTAHVIEPAEKIDAYIKKTMSAAWFAHKSPFALVDEKGDLQFVNPGDTIMVFNYFVQNPEHDTELVPVKLQAVADGPAGSHKFVFKDAFGNLKSVGPADMQLPEKEAAPSAPTASSPSAPVLGKDKVGNDIHKGDTVAHPKKGLGLVTGTVEGGGGSSVWYKVKRADGTVDNVHAANMTVKTAPSGAPAHAPATQVTPAVPVAAPNPDEYVPHGQWVPGHMNSQIFQGTTVKSAKDGLEGIVTQFAPKGDYVWVTTSTGKFARKASTLIVTGHSKAEGKKIAKAGEETGFHTKHGMNGPVVTSKLSPVSDSDKTHPLGTTSPAKEPIVQGPWTGKPKPALPLSVSASSVTSYTTADWLKSVEGTYAKLGKGKPLASSHAYSHVKGVINSGDLKELDHLLKIGYVTKQQYDEAKNQIEAAKQIKAAELATQLAANDRYTKDLADWMTQNGVVDEFSPQHFVQKGMTGAKDWSGNSPATAWAKSVWPNSSFYESSWVSSLKNYTGAGYSQINSGLCSLGHQSLFSVDGLSGSTKPKVRNIDKAMEAAPRVPEDIIIYRGSGGDAFILPNGQKAYATAGFEAIKGTVQTNYGYTSASVGTGSAFSSHSVQMKIRVPKGYKAVWVHGNGISTHQERELLLDRGVHFYIHNVYQSGSKWIVEAEIVPPGWKPSP